MAAPANLLWTAGWDSTFRLLDLTVRQGRRVQPFYIVDEGRRSTALEQATSERIKTAIADRFGPEVRGLVLDTITTPKSASSPSPEVTAAFMRLREKWSIGTQNEWLPVFAERQGLVDLELSTHVGDQVQTALAGNAVLDGDAFVVVPAPSDPDLALFRHFRFPLFEMTKLDMGKAAGAAGFAPLLELTVFCHTPDRQGRPCGLCAPCSTTLAAGLGRRIPWRGHLRHRARRLRSVAGRTVRRLAR